MITVKDVSVKFPHSGRAALSDVGFVVGKGEFAFLIGPSGSGKSTLLRALLRDEKVDSGSIIVADKDVLRLRGGQISRFRRQIGCVFQDYRLMPRMTVGENIAFALRVIGKSEKVIRKSVPDVLDLVGLGGKEKRFPSELSGGEQQRVAIARACVNRPLVLLADEPTGNLDRKTADDIVALLQRINRSGTTVLMATHDDRIVDSLRTHVIELNFGKVARDEKTAVYGSQLEW